MLYSAKVSLSERATKTMLADFFFILLYWSFWNGAKASVWCKHWHGFFGTVPTSFLALVLKVSSCNAGVPFWVSLLLNHYSKGSMSLRIVSRLENASILPNLVNWPTFGIFYAILHFLVAGSIFWGLVSTYTVSFGLKKHKPLLVCMGTVKEFLFLDLWLLIWTISSG